MDSSFLWFASGWTLGVWMSVGAFYWGVALAKKHAERDETGRSVR